MAAAAASHAGYNIVKEAVDVGVELNSLYKTYKNQLQPSVDDALWGVSRLQVRTTPAGQDAGQLRRHMRVIEQENPKVFDNQASLLALFSEGIAWICGGGLDAIQSEIDKGFDSVIRTVLDQDAIRAARDLKFKLNTAAVACNRLLDDIVAATESQQKHLPAYACKDIQKAESSATELYQWAKSFVPNNLGGMPKPIKLQTMPYIVAMAYAARIQVLTHLLERDMAEKECDRIVYLRRAREVVDDFIAVLARALEGIMADTSLLEVAMVYHLPLATYLTLMTSFRASVDDLLSPNAKAKDIAVWDDGLQPIRDILQWKGGYACGEQEQTIELSSKAEWAWWATFTDTNLDITDLSKMRTIVHIHELYHILGARDSDDRIDHVALIPGRKHALLQLPPASALRAALCANIARTCQAPPPPSFASISPPPPACLHAAAPRTICGHTSFVTSVAVCADGKRVLSGSPDSSAKLWSLGAGQHLHTFFDPKSSMRCVAVSPDGRRAVSESGGKKARVWSLESGIAQCKLRGHSADVMALALSPDGRSIASGSRDKRIKLWKADSGRCQATLSGHRSTVYCVAFSPDGETLVSGSADTSIRVWNLRTHKLERSLRGHSNAVQSVALTPDGRRLVSGSWDKTIKVWSLSSGAEVMSLEGHAGAVTCVAVFPDGQRIASSSWDESVRVWNVRSQALELTLMGHSKWVNCVAVSPDGRSVVSGSGDNTIKVWPLNGGDGDGDGDGVAG